MESLGGEQKQEREERVTLSQTPPQRELISQRTISFLSCLQE